ncbi:MAG: class I adenylate-forming enzyme family protein, partial [Solirubrobacteraceae bacterium]
MIELIRAGARQQPSRPAAITNAGATTYADLLANAESAADWFSAHSVKRFAIVDQDAATVIALLAGASLAGAEACVYPPIEPPRLAAELTERFDHRLVISADMDLEADIEVIAPASVLASDGERLGQPAGEGLRERLAEPAGARLRQPLADRPLLVLTTGTTGAPRGVRHDWGRVMRSARHIVPTPDQRWVLAFGMQQFAGLQMLVAVMAAQATLVAPSPRRPRQALAAMREHGVDHASATPTFWRFLLVEARSDGGELPALRQITLGGEAVPGPLLAELEATFPGARISQIYAANESGSLRSVRDGQPGLPTALLNTGDDADVALRIVDGELHVRSRIGMVGYYGEPPVDPEAWRPTGDLVEVVGDRVLFRGRSSDVINVGGVKVHPLPIEERISTVPGVEVARVYGRPNPVTGAIVAVEVVPAAGADHDELDAAIREACDELPPASRPRTIRFVDELATTGHKISRARCPVPAE